MNTLIKKDTENFMVRNEQIEVTSDFRFDVETSEKVSDNVLDNKAIQKAFDIYRKTNGIMTKEEILETRKKYKLSQDEFASFSGIDVATIIRYENGQIPTKTNNQLLKSLRNI